MAMLLISFLQNGAQLDAVNNHGQSPLHAVADVGNLAHAQEFIQHGADVLAADDDGDAPFDAAMTSGEDNIVDCVLTEACKDQVVEQEGDRTLF